MSSLKISIQLIPHKLRFKFNAGTSRGVLTEKVSYFLVLKDHDKNVLGIGEAGPLPKLSVDDYPEFLALASDLLRQLELPSNLTTETVFEYVSTVIPNKFPSIRLALESALLDYLNGSQRIYFDNDFSRGHRSILINGLIWMGDKEFMLKQIETKLDEGFKCLKLKIGAIDFVQECSILQSIRDRYTLNDLELRVDANGAFNIDEALEKLTVLSEFNIHSIEQPIRAGQVEEMAQLCRQSPLPVALDEELIGGFDLVEKRRILEKILPQYIILKPTLLGGFKETDEWITTAQELNIAWWVTSALESNVGLAAISQYIAQFNNVMPQGLGTGKLYNNNLTSPLSLQGERLHYNLTTGVWDLKQLEENF